MYACRVYTHGMCALSRPHGHLEHLAPRADKHAPRGHNAGRRAGARRAEGRAPHTRRHAARACLQRRTHVSGARTRASPSLTILQRNGDARTPSHPRANLSAAHDGLSTAPSWPYISRCESPSQEMYRTGGNASHRTVATILPGSRAAACLCCQAEVSRAAVACAHE